MGRDGPMGVVCPAAPSVGRAPAGRRRDGQAGQSLPVGLSPCKPAWVQNQGWQTAPQESLMFAQNSQRREKFRPLGLDLMAGGASVLDEEKESHTELARGLGIV